MSAAREELVVAGRYADILQMANVDLLQSGDYDRRVPLPNARQT